MIGLGIIVGGRAKKPLTVALVTVALVGGRSTARIADYQPPSRSTTERIVEQSGVEIALDPFVETDRTEEYFALDATGEGIAILHVRITNKTSDRTFLVEKKNVQLLPSGNLQGPTGSDKKIERSQTGATTAAWVGTAGLLVSPIAGISLVLAGSALASKSSEIQRNMTSKEMADATLSPGKSMEGFIYFAPVEKDQDWSRGTTARVGLTDTTSQQMLTLNVALSR